MNSHPACEPKVPLNNLKDSNPTNLAHPRVNQSIGNADRPKQNADPSKTQPTQKTRENVKAGPDTGRSGKDLAPSNLIRADNPKNANPTQLKPPGGLRDTKSGFKAQSQPSHRSSVVSKAQQLRLKLSESFPEKYSKIEQAFQDFYGKSPSMTDKPACERYRAELPKLGDSNPAAPHSQPNPAS